MTVKDEHVQILSREIKFLSGIGATPLSDEMAGYVAHSLLYKGWVQPEAFEGLKAK